MKPETLELCSNLLLNKISQAKLANLQGVLLGGKVFLISELEEALTDLDREIMGTMAGNAKK